MSQTRVIESVIPAQTKPAKSEPGNDSWVKVSLATVNRILNHFLELAVTLDREHINRSRQLLSMDSPTCPSGRDMNGIGDQAGFHLPTDDARIPANLRLLPLPPYCPELNPVERFGGLIKAAVANRLYPNLRKLEDHLVAAARPWSTPTAVASLIHTWLADKVNAGALA